MIFLGIIIGLVVGVWLRGFTKSVDEASNFDEDWTEEDLKVKDWLKDNK